MPTSTSMPHLTPFSACLAMAALLAACPASAAQSVFEPAPWIREHFDPLIGSAFESFDADGDGDQDVLVENQLYLNDGAGELTLDVDGRIPTLPGSVSWMHRGDLDGDGDHDLLQLQGGSLRLLDNDGANFFSDESSTRLPSVGPSAITVAAGDVDGDGDVDLVLGRFEPSSFFPGTIPVQNRLWLNDGHGRFQDQSGGRLPIVSDVTLSTVLVDIDGDSDLDLIFGNVGPPFGGPPTRVLQNDGTGHFLELSSTGLPPQGSWVPTVAKDLDMDGDMDLLTAGHVGPGVLENDGNGTFTASEVLPPVTGNVEHFDADGDGHADLLVSGRIFLQDPSGGWTEDTTARLPRDTTHPIAHAMDWDGDGDQDLLFGSGTRHVNVGDGYFAATRLPSTPSFFIRGNDAVVIADLNGDGEQDMIVTGTVLLRDGGRWIEGPSLFPSSGVLDLEAADVDGDGDLDLLAADRQFAPTLLVNDGGASFTPAASGAIPDHLGGPTLGIEARDFDGDGHLDLVVAAGSQLNSNSAPCQFTGQAVFYLGDGSGRFRDVSAQRLPGINQLGTAVASGDIDGDGDLDLVLASGSIYAQTPFDPTPAAPCYRNRILLNAGGGHFTDGTAGRLPESLRSTLAVALEDLDQDGDLDLIFGNQGPDQLLLNDGQGAFVDVTSTHLPTSAAVTRSIAFGDLDGDGHPDLVLAQSEAPGARTAVLLNDGDGLFHVAPPALFGPHLDGMTQVVAVADVNRDRDLDVLLVNGAWRPGTGGPASGGGSAPFGTRGYRLLTNLAREIRAPRLAQIGEEYEIHVWSRFLDPRLATLAIPMIAMGTASRPLGAMGTLGLDPRTLVALPAVTLSPQTGQGVVSVRIPDDPQLVGMSLHMQALVLSFPGTPQLTEVVSDRFTR